ncbi:hypothetical protein [Halobellus rufus]|uniref:hypothetical protein n=1 Tax=Halobellus rufus TaxID=1448860 RepID=UPI0012E0118D|nr:hypothetical protein [Halobellus rufus]
MREPAPETEVWVADGSDKPVYHRTTECIAFQTGRPVGESTTPQPTTVGELPDRFRPCGRCEYYDVPTLEDAPPVGDRAQGNVHPWIVYAGTAIGLALFAIGVYGGAL